MHKWVAPHNWKFGAENFIGDGYHGTPSHRSAQLTSPQGITAGLVPAVTRKTGTENLTISFPNGHGVLSSVAPEQWNSRDSLTLEPHADPEIDAYFKQAYEERFRRLGGLLLDCKNEPCQPFKPGAPKSVDHLCQECDTHFTSLRSLLEGLGIDYSIDYSLVRGIDYYARTAFEFQPKEEGAQSTLGGGGRYDGLIEQLGGKPTPGIGFGTGLERNLINLKRQGLGPEPSAGPDAFVAVGDASAQVRALVLARDLRQAGSTAVVGVAGRSLKGQMRQANTLAARFALILGAEEMATNTVSVRDLGSGSQETLSVEETLIRLRRA